MKKLITLFLIISCVFSLTAFSPVESDAAQGTITKYTTATVNVRQKPSTKSKVMMVLNKGKSVQVTYHGKKWDTVKIKDKKYYIYNKYLSTKKQSQQAKVQSINNAKYSPAYFKRMGVINWNGWRWTWYSQRVLSGGGLKIPGRHVGERGYVMDQNGYICLASSSLSKGTVVSTPFGAKGKVYDSGCAAGTLDVYVDW